VKLFCWLRLNAIWQSVRVFLTANKKYSVCPSKNCSSLTKRASELSRHFCYKNVTTHLESRPRFPPSVHIIPYPVVDIPEAGEGHDDGLVDEVHGLVDEAGQGRGRDSRLEAPGGGALNRGRVLRGPVTAVNVLQVLALLVIERSVFPG